MNGFEFLREANSYFFPRTPRAALKAIEEGLLPDVAYLYKAISVSPLYEDVNKIEEIIPDIERILSNESNELGTNLLLMSIFEQLLGHKDQEIALFAAESINAIENQYNERIEKLKKELAGDDPSGARRGIARQFYEVARINDTRPAIKRFYLAESYAYLKELYRNGKFRKDDIQLTVDVLVALELPDRARYILERIKGDSKDDPDMLMLRAAVEFKAKRFSGVAEIMDRVKQKSRYIDRERQDLVKLWIEARDA